MEEAKILKKRQLVIPIHIRKIFGETSHRHPTTATIFVEKTLERQEDRTEGFTFGELFVENLTAHYFRVD